MKIQIIGPLCVCLLAGCAGLEQDARRAGRALETPDVTLAGTHVRLTVNKPSARCTFKGGVLGDSNPDAEGWILGGAELSADVENALKDNAASMGGNTVWMRGVSWHNTDVSYDYANPFIVSNVEYKALVYDCP